METKKPTTFLGTSYKSLKCPACKTKYTVLSFRGNPRLCAPCSAKKYKEVE